MKRVWLIVLLGIGVSASGQKTQKRDLVSGDYFHELEYLTDSKRSIEANVECYWLDDGVVRMSHGISPKTPLHGEYTKKNKKGVIVEHGFFNHGLKDGQWTEWNDSGKLLCHGSFSNGLKHGKWMYYDLQGIVVSTEKYRRDELVVEEEKVKTDQPSDSSNRATDLPVKRLFLKSGESSEEKK